MAHEIPTVVGHYVLQQVLGKGGFGCVRLANNMFKSEIVACKQIKCLSLTPKQKDKIDREIQFLQKFSHPNIIRFRKVIQDFDFINIFMEYAAGGTLHAYIQKQGFLHESIARDFFRQIHNAVKYLHDLFIVHRDLKTDNILITQELVPKIVDFGLSEYFTPGEKTDQNGWCGTLGYRSPEMVLKAPYIGPEVDIWSLGVILFEMVSGRLPFSDTEMDLEKGVGLGIDEKEVNQRIVNRQFVVIVKMSASLKSLVYGMLTPDPETRFTNEQIATSEWINEPSHEMPSIKEDRSPVSPRMTPIKHHHESIDEPDQSTDSDTSPKKEKNRSFSLNMWTEGGRSRSLSPLNDWRTSSLSKSPPHSHIHTTTTSNKGSRSKSPLTKFSTFYRSTFKHHQIEPPQQEVVPL